MKLLRIFAAALFVLFAFVLPSNGCGPFFAEAEFVQLTRPDGIYADYVKGRIGVPQTQYRLRHLIAGYDWMNGHGLTPGEQQQMVALDQELYGNPPRADMPEGRLVPGSDYQTFQNCLPDAFAVAKQTHEARHAAHGEDPASVADWERGQTAVFSNCSGSGNTLPEAAAANAPLWLKQDRAYQTAAAKFYTADYDGAIAELRTISADRDSPWRDTARLVIARAMIRKATNGQITEMPAAVPVNANAQTQEQSAQAAERYKVEQRYEEAIQRQRPARLAEARDVLRPILADPSMQQFHATAGRLLDFVMLRLDPAAQGEILAARTMGAKRAQTAGQFRQAVIDLDFLLGSSDAQSDHGITRLKIKPDSPDAGLTWLRAMKGAVSVASESAAVGPESHPSALEAAVSGWHATHRTPWLIAALTAARPGDSTAAELTHDAAGVPKNSPAWMAATYHRLRLTIAEPGTRTELDALLPDVERTQSRSTINLFMMLHERSSPTLETFLEDAGTLPAGIDNGYSEEPDAPATKLGAGLCGVRSSDAMTRLFDHDTATILNTRMPLSMLAEAAESKTLVPNLRFQIAQSTWTRAVLLERPEIAKDVAQVLSGCYPAWKPWLEKYDAAATANDRRAAGLLALMRFASTEPIVRDGLQRPDGFAAYDSYRDNWWRESRTYRAATNGSAAVSPTFFGTQPIERDEMPAPPFLSATDRAVAAREVVALRAIPCASDYFARSALEWQKQHPADPRTPDILGFAQRVVRNGCRTDATKELNHRLFVVTQTKYPKSAWAKLYRSWE
ncbi:MAG: hypothetical protein M3R43_06060 [Acidobacteriota bacterium]|nr:hypothetical protein [Acidobacteriota bacterium]